MLMITDKCLKKPISKNRPQNRLSGIIGLFRDSSGAYFDSCAAQYRLLAPSLINEKTSAKLRLESDSSGAYFDSCVAQHRLLAPNLINEKTSAKLRFGSDSSGARTQDPLLKREIHIPPQIN